MFSKMLLSGVIERLTDQGDESELDLRLIAYPVVKTLSLPKIVIEALNLKVGTHAHAAFFPPWSDIFPGQKMITISYRKEDPLWVTIPYGNATPAEIKILMQNLPDPSADTLEAWKYMYRNKNEFESAKYTAFRNGGCAPHTYMQQIEAIRKIDGSWMAFRHGSDCEARIRNTKKLLPDPSAAEEEAWSHGFCELGECQEEKNNGLTIGADCGPFLAGFLYSGSDAHPDFNKSSFTNTPVNIYLEKKNGNDNEIEYIGQSIVK